MNTETQTTATALEFRKPTETCNARLSDKKRHCLRPAGWRTDHLGEGRCRTHNGPPPKYGAHSKLSRYRDHKTLGERVARAEEDPQLLDPTKEIALLQAMLEKFIHERIERDLTPDEQRSVRIFVRDLIDAKDRAFRAKRAWTDERARSFLAWVAEVVKEAIRRELPGASNLEVAGVLVRLEAEAHRFRV